MSPRRPLAVDPDASLLGDPRFRRYWAAGVADALAGGLRGIALPWLVLALTGSPLQLGVVFALASAPDVLVSPLVGAAIDRFPRRRLLAAADVARGLALLPVPALALAGALAPWHLYAAMLALSVLGNLSHNTRRTLLPALVEESRLDAANAWFDGATAALGVGFVLVGGALTATVGAAPVLVAAAGAAVLAGLLVLAVPTPPCEPAPAARSVAGNLRAGLATIRDTPPVLSVLLLGVGINLFVAPWTSVVLPTAGRALGDAVAFTALLGGYRGGTLAGNAAVARLAWSRERKLVAGVAVVGVGGVAAGAAGGLLAGPGALLAATAALAVAGLGQPLFNAPSSSIIQSAVDENRRGTVLTVQNSALEASFPLPLLAAGALLGAVSPFALLAASGLGMLGLAATAAPRFGVGPAGRD